MNAAKALVAAIVVLALSGCASQHRPTVSNLTPEQRAIAIGALMNHWQPVQAYQQPFYPMQTVPRSGFSCSRVGSIVSCY